MKFCVWIAAAILISPWGVWADVRESVLCGSVYGGTSQPASYNATIVLETENGLANLRAGDTVTLIAANIPVRKPLPQQRRVERAGQGRSSYHYAYWQNAAKLMLWIEEDGTPGCSIYSKNY